MPMVLPRQIEEQILIKKHSGARSMRGTSGNAINGIGAKNKNASRYIEAARKAFGD